MGQGQFHVVEHGPLRNPQTHGNLLLGQPFQAAENQDLLSTLRQPVEGSSKGLQTLLIYELSFRCRTWVCDFGNHFLTNAGEVGSFPRDDLATMINGEIVSSPFQESPNLLDLAGRECRMDSDESLLSQIFCSCRIVNDALDPLDQGSAFCGEKHGQVHQGIMVR